MESLKTHYTIEFLNGNFQIPNEVFKLMTIYNDINMNEIISAHINTDK